MNLRHLRRCSDVTTHAEANSHPQRGGLEFHPNLTSGHKTQTIRSLLSIRVSKKKICLGTSLQSACQHESHFQAKPGTLCKKDFEKTHKSPHTGWLLARSSRDLIAPIPGCGSQQRLIERRSTSGSQHQLNVTQTRTLLLAGSPLP